MHRAGFSPVREGPPSGMANVRPCTEYMASNRGFLSAGAIPSRVGTFGRRESRWGDVTTKTLIKFFSSRLGEPISRPSNRASFLPNLLANHLLSDQRLCCREPLN